MPRSIIWDEPARREPYGLSGPLTFAATLPVNSPCRTLSASPNVLPESAPCAQDSPQPGRLRGSAAGRVRATVRNDFLDDRSVHAKAQAGHRRRFNQERKRAELAGLALPDLACQRQKDGRTALRTYTHGAFVADCLGECGGVPSSRALGGRCWGRVPRARWRSSAGRSRAVACMRS